jgi:predicted dienelactone hydrolase
MKILRRLLLVLIALGIFGAVFVKGLLPAVPMNGVAVANVSIPDPGAAALATIIWYPVGTGKAADAGKHPLVIISHGTGGGRMGHIDTAVALARAGYVVAAVEHTGDNAMDLSHVKGGWYRVERPRHISRAIDYLLTKWRGHAMINADRIGLFGHSAGGYTALVVAGAKPDLSRSGAYCKAHPASWNCQYWRKHNMQLSERSPVNWVPDPRVKAIVIAAPAIGYSFDQTSMAGVKVPVQLWEAERDEIVGDSAQHIASLLPAAERHREKGTGHFSFLFPCNWQMRTFMGVLHWFGTEKICDDAGPLDRAAFHQKMNRDVVQFFERSM